MELALRVKFTDSKKYLFWLRSNYEYDLLDIWHISNYLVQLFRLDWWCTAASFFVLFLFHSGVRSCFLLPYQVHHKRMKARSTLITIVHHSVSRVEASFVGTYHVGLQKLIHTCKRAEAQIAKGKRSHKSVQISDYRQLPSLTMLV